MLLDVLQACDAILSVTATLILVTAGLVAIVIGVDFIRDTIKEWRR